MKRRERFETFLSKVEILADLDSYERGKICDVLETEYFEDGKEVITQGEKGDKFFLIEEGEALAYKTDASIRLLTKAARERRCTSTRPTTTLASWLCSKMRTELLPWSQRAN